MFPIEIFGSLEFPFVVHFITLRSILKKIWFHMENAASVQYYKPSILNQIVI